MQFSKINKLVAAAVTTIALTTSGAVFADKGDSSKGQHRLIIKFKEDANDKRSKRYKRSLRARRISNALAKQAWHLKETGLKSDVFVVENTTSDEMNDMMNEISSMSDVLYVEEDKLMHHMLQPNDPRYSDQRHYFDQGTSINAPDAWDKATGQGVIVAVLDTGYRPHADLNDNILPGYDMISSTDISNDGNGRDSDARDTGDWTVDNQCEQGRRGTNSSWHGTHVAGTIAAETNNNRDVAGVAFNAKVVPVRVLGMCGGFTSDIADGIIWASGGSVAGVPNNANPAQVINMSLGGGGSCSQTYINAINTARSNGATVVVAAGNSNINASNAVPANCPGVLTVAATGPTGAKASYSNFGNVVDVAAPGGDISSFGQAGGVLSTLNAGTRAPGADSLAFYQGTSMATPHVAGIAALLYEVKPDATPDEIEAAIVSSAQPFPGSCSQCGSGIADANAAIDAILGNNGGGNPDPGTGFEPINFNVSVPRVTRNNFRHYTLNMPAGATTMNVNISGGSGDADLYVRFGARPTTSAWDFRPFLDGNNESVTVDNPQAGTWYISVRAFQTFSGVTLSGNVE
ncbi:peptidase S8 [Alteromonadaceae bacterium M269]|nr:peptidase S8 [Alteromonadaceae bacterium M269]